MKKTLKLISKYMFIFLIIMMISIPNIYAADKMISADDYKPTEGTDLGRMGEIGDTIIGGIQLVGSILSVIILIIIGIRFIMGSAEEKAEYKKSLMPYLIGAIMLFSISTFLGIIKAIVN